MFFPNEILSNIFMYLPISLLQLRVRRVSRQCKDVTDYIVPQLLIKTLEVQIRKPWDLPEGHRPHWFYDDKVPFTCIDIKDNMVYLDTKYNEKPFRISKYDNQFGEIRTNIWDEIVFAREEDNYDSLYHWYGTVERNSDGFVSDSVEFTYDVIEIEPQSEISDSESEYEEDPDFFIDDIQLKIPLSKLLTWEGEKIVSMDDSEVLQDSAYHQRRQDEWQRNYEKALE
jgi:hypothetical protein